MLLCHHLDNLMATRTGRQQQATTEATTAAATAKNAMVLQVTRRNT